MERLVPQDANTGRSIEHRRNRLVRWISKVFPTDRLPDANPFDPFDEVARRVEEGYGVVVLYSHFSKSDHLRAVAHVVKEVPALATRRILSPVAIHQYNKKLRLLARYGHLELKPLVTGDTEKRKPKIAAKFSRKDKSKMMVDFIKTERQVLDEGGLVAIAPQAERRGKLGTPSTNAVKNLLDKYDNKKIVFVFAGLGIDGEVDYSRDKNQGYNMRKKLTVRFGTAMTRTQLEVDVIARRLKIDDLVFEKLAKVVPPEYL